MTGHWSHTCRTPKHFVDLYQASLKNTGKRGESHTIEINPTAINTVEANNISVGGTPLAPEVANASLDSLISLRTFDYFDKASDWWMTSLISNFMILIISFLVVFL